MSGSRETAPCSMLHPVASRQSPVASRHYSTLPILVELVLSRVRAEPRSNINCHGRCRYRCLDRSSVGACIGHWGNLCGAMVRHWDSEMSGKSCGSGQKTYRFTKGHLHRCPANRFQFRGSSQRMYWQRGFQEPDVLYGDKQCEASTTAKQTSPYAIRLEVRETRRLNYRIIGFICLE